MADTAALMQQLDLVIAVDTAVVHLAGALGRPVWVMLPFSPDWRWLLDREDSPWYPTMRLFRQPSFGDWPAVVEACGPHSAIGATIANSQLPDASASNIAPSCGDRMREAASSAAQIGNVCGYVPQTCRRMEISHRAGLRITCQIM